MPAQADPTLVNLRPRTWDHVLVGPDGRTLLVYFWNGTPACTGLGDVQVTQGDGEPRIELWIGDVPGAPEECPAVAQLYRTVVVLDERLIRGGELLDLPGG
jgi:hypothetical protein